MISRSHSLQALHGLHIARAAVVEAAALVGRHPAQADATPEAIVSADRLAVVVSALVREISRLEVETGRKSVESPPNAAPWEVCEAEEAAAAEAGPDPERRPSAGSACGLDQTQPRLFEIWVEGYRATGDSAPASYCGELHACTFQEACNKLYGSNELYNPAKLTYWGCRLFDNEADARRSFG